MSTPKAEEPLSAKLQADYAKKSFASGTGVKRDNIEAVLANQKRDNASMQTAISSARSSAEMRNATLKKRRAGSNTSVSTRRGGEATASAFSQTKAGGKTSSNREIARDINGTAQTLSMASAFDHKSSMQDFIRKNAKKQALMDIGTSAALAYAYKEDKPKKVNKDTMALNLDSSYTEVDSLNDPTYPGSVNNRLMVS